MVMQRACSFIKVNGEPCRSSPLLDDEFCFWHSPSHAEEADQARRLGGQRRRREKVTEGAYDLEGLDSVQAVRRLLQIALLDTLGLENSVARNRALMTGVLAAARLLELGEMEQRIGAIEAALAARSLAAPERRSLNTVWWQ